MKIRLITLVVTGASLATAQTVQAETVYALTPGNRLLSFDHTAPGNILTDFAISGLQAGENVVGIDVRATTGEIMAVTSSRIYSVDRSNGVASLIGSGFAPVLDPAEYGIDFNPTVDRIRVVSSLGHNRRLNPVNGANAAVDPALSYAGGGVPRAVGVAYTNSRYGGVPAGSVRELIIDSELDILGEVGSMAGGNASFNAGVTTVLGSLGVSTNDLVGFDIHGPTGLSLVSLTDPATNLSSLYTINTSTGATGLLGGIGNQLTIRDITIVPEPATLLLALGSAALMFRRRKA